MNEQEKDRVYNPGDPCSKTGYTILDIIQFKHTGAWTLKYASLNSYPGHSPVMVPLDLTVDTVKEVVRQIYGGTGLGRTDSLSVYHWLLRC